MFIILKYLLFYGYHLSLTTYPVTIEKYNCSEFMVLNLK